MKLDTPPVSVSDLSATETDLNQPIVKDKPQESVFMVFGTTFITIFLAEIGDKTQLSTLLMSAESHAPWVVFAGSGAALITTSLLGVLLGGWISTKLSPKTVEKSAGVMLLLISLMLVWDVIQG
ncbi:TMEM165/GDT1 family protein [Dolichospermum sp. ST_sed1]|nr:TMEM165/GDT1 family protein [Dolichospermum sp. ST_sed1]MDD1423836.1 TMEM165/GDT1 family protein [Dolichospermum sp. ST_sed9]MDD1429810.1 TMEM165/GDT1 family protein [Dolichospermum sp. ST_sed6]MDD1436942.1 TMEM165/GDT1 family protein [Dolichospermum sp. ST_sed10]MDD1441687.1 TMEM165/GDT1 family protein [Dolichospermum sp. ST_sed3]MDD1444808.1 TMEM165/GDT1 family protein [Dolichospermum sp. ST_sed8]MDD1453531.1 TMEM165/GDT1 family protein [Dolichospermum sp. ST_sed7]MDD1458939.1 TMEM165/G